MPHVEERELCMKTVNDFRPFDINAAGLTNGSHRQPAASGGRSPDDFHHLGAVTNGARRLA
jgi:hypothetical protein